MSSITDISQLLDLNALARFAAVVKHRGFSPAARALGVPRQSLHRTVDRLEQQVGVSLLTRSRRSMRPTDTGHRLYTHALRILDAALDATELARAAKDHPQGLLRVEAPPFFAQLHLGPTLQRFLTRWPDVRVELNMPSDPIRDDHDLAIQVGISPREDQIATKLGQVRSRCCASPSYLRDRKPLDNPADLVDEHAFVVFGAPGAMAWRFRRDAEVMEVHPPKPRLRVDDMRVAAEAVVNGLGVGLIPEPLAVPHLASGVLVPVFPRWSLEPEQVWAILAGRSNRDPTLRAFLDAVRIDIPRSTGGRGGGRAWT